MESSYFCLGMDLEGWIGHFRTASSVTTQTTRLLPSKSAAIGMLLAKTGIIRTDYQSGFPKEYVDLLKDIKVGMAFTHHSAEKFVDYVSFRKKNFQQKPIKIEYLVFPKYSLVFLIPRDNAFLGEQALEQLLDPSFEHFKLCAGVNECPLSIQDISLIESCSPIDSPKQLTTRFALPKDVIASLAVKDALSLAYTDVYLSPPPSSKEHKLDARIFAVPLGKKLHFTIKKEWDANLGSPFRIGNEEVWLI